jgi:hypothetical protein
MITVHYLRSDVLLAQPALWFLRPRVWIGAICCGIWTRSKVIVFPYCLRRVYQGESIEVDNRGNYGIAVVAFELMNHSTCSQMHNLR